MVESSNLAIAREFSHRNCLHGQHVRAVAQELDGFQIVGPCRVGHVHKGQQGAQLGEHHRPGCMDTASFVAKPESLPLFVVFVLFGHVVINPGIPLASS